MNTSRTNNKTKKKDTWLKEMALVKVLAGKRNYHETESTNGSYTE